MTSLDYSITPVRHRTIIDAEVLATEQLSDLMLRLTFFSPDFIGQEAISCTDTYMKLIVHNPSNPEEKALRSYTVRSHDVVAGTVEIDFALHTNGGYAAQWARTAQVGDRATFKGIGGGYNPSPLAPWHLLIGDDSALPAIAAGVEKIAGDSRVVVVLEGPSKEALLGEAYDLELPEGGELVVVNSTEQILAQVAHAFEANEGTPHVFLHGEACMVRDVRRDLRATHAQELKTMSVSGYWRSGATDEQWREMKRDFAQQQEADETKALEAVSH